MQLIRLALRSFRAHPATRLELAPRLNLLHGPNGAGKTNLLEAIHYLCLSKSFLTAHDAHALRRGDDHFEIIGTLAGEQRRELEVRLAYVPSEGKRLFVNGVPLERLADIVGKLPVVIMAPEDVALTAGGPEERRRFLDNVLSQAHPAYLHDLLRYRRTIRQRNALLMDRRGDPSGLAAWTQELAELGARVTSRRHRFLEQFGGFLERAYERLEGVGGRPTFRYRAAVALEDHPSDDEIVERLLAKLHAVERRERERGRTLVGPHRDELALFIDDLELRPFGSQGQHRTFGLSLKLATYFFLRDHLDETPLLLLDDLFGILDPIRSRAFLNLLRGDEVGQSILTAARLDTFNEAVDFSRPEHKAIEIVNGAAAGAPPLADARAA